MVVIVGAVAVVATGGAAAPIVAEAVVVAEGVGATAVATTTGAAVGTTRTAVIGGGAAVAEGASLGVAAALTNPIGWCILGASQHENAGNYTWDCWKPLLHDKSEQKSNGRLLKEVLCDKSIKSVAFHGLIEDPSKCSFVVKNIWNETFDITPVILPDGNTAFHATKKIDCKYVIYQQKININYFSFW